MKKTHIFNFIFLFIFLILLYNWGESLPVYRIYGSFEITDKLYSYDEKYYACQGIIENEVVILIFDSSTKNVVETFHPCRSRDFYGMCWENDSYDLWIDSHDIGILCFEENDLEWVHNPDAEQPDYIVSRRDS